MTFRISSSQIESGEFGEAWRLQSKAFPEEDCGNEVGYGILATYQTVSRIKKPSWVLVYLQPE